MSRMKTSAKKKSLDLSPCGKWLWMCSKNSLVWNVGSLLSRVTMLVVSLTCTFSDAWFVSMTATIFRMMRTICRMMRTTPVRWDLLPLHPMDLCLRRESRMVCFSCGHAAQRELLLGRHWQQRYRCMTWSNWSLAPSLVCAVSKPIPFQPAGRASMRVAHWAVKPGAPMGRRLPPAAKRWWSVGMLSPGALHGSWRYWISAIFSACGMGT